MGPVCAVPSGYPPLPLAAGAPARHRLRRQRESVCREYLVRVRVRVRVKARVRARVRVRVRVRVRALHLC